MMVFIAMGCAPKEFTDKVCFQGGCFRVEVVEDEKDLQQGLMKRQSLADTAGMLFIFKTNRRHSFWMKNTVIPLDMIWIDYAREVVHIQEKVLPCKSDPCPTYRSNQKALYVLEINAGAVQKFGIVKGEQVAFHLDQYENRQ